MKMPRYIRSLCMALILVLLVQMLPLSVFAQEYSESASASGTVADKETEDAAAYVVEEMTEKRTEYSKEFRLSNGLHMTAVYMEPVHYERSGNWEEIDNTLKALSSARNSGYRNTAGVWDVRFPGALSGENAVTITKDGYTLSFYMSGQLKTADRLQAASANIAAGASSEASPDGEAVSVESVAESTAQVQTDAVSEEKQSARYSETVAEKLHSQLVYADVFADTSIVYDLVSNRVKESIVIGAYNADLLGYRYTLNTGDMLPVLTESGEILLYDKGKEDIVMVMPAPYLVDAAGEYNGDVAVSLTGADGVYTLTYRLPDTWMADKARQYPVVLDPIVEAEATTANVEDLTVNQTGQVTDALLNVGKSSSYGIMRSFVKFKQLPELAASDIVVEATFRLHHIKAASAGFPVGVHKVLTPWSESTLAWSNQPAHNPIVEDFNMVDADNTNYTWDVTEIVRDWYLKGNTGLMLRGPDSTETSGGLLQFASESYSKYSIPALTITFRSSVGIEPYYTYATLGAGNAGGVYICDSTGQITAMRQVASYASTVNPFSLNLVYNSSNYYTEKENLTGYFPLRSLGLPVSIGNGWGLDVVQKLEPLTIGQTQYLLYHDGDGTRHYLRKSGSKYCDEDGLGLTVVANADGSYTMSDEMDNKWFFTDLTSQGITGCFLTSTLDNNGNGYAMEYADGKLLSIVQKNRNQSDITVASFTYMNQTLTAITDATGGRYNLRYSGPYLVSITRVDAAGASTLCAEYTYETSRLTSMKDAIRNYTLHLEYGALSSDGKRLLSSGRLSSYWEESNGTTGVRCDITYPGYTQTTYHSYGNDRTAGNADDLYTHYLFDFAGRTVNAYTTDSTGANILGASTAVYTENEGISKKNNRTERTASIGVAAQKLLTGGDFEGATNLWTRTNADVYESGSGNYISHTGKRSLMGIPSTVTTVSSSYRNTQSLQAGTPYTISAYIRTTNLTNFQTNNASLVNGPGVYLKIVTADGHAYYTDSVDYATDSAVDGGWVPVAMTFTPQVTGVAKVYVIGEGAQGVFYVDDIQLEQSQAPSNYNLLENGDLQASTTSASFWTLRSDVSFCGNVGVNATGAGNHSIKIEGDCQNKYAIAYQEVQIHKRGQQSYVLSGWGKADAVVDNITLRSDPAYDHTKQFGLRATVSYEGDTENTYKEYYYVPFNPDISTWQYASLTITPRRTDMTVANITVSCVYECNANTAWFDNLSLVNTTVQEMEYDNEGRPISSSSTGVNGQSITYDSNGNVKTVSTPNPAGGSVTQTYTYDATFTHRLVSSSNGVIQQSMTHDAVGNVSSTTLQSATNTSGRVITSSALYTNGGNLQSTVTDSAGNITSYAYETARHLTWGIPSKITDAKGTKTTYTLDNFGRYENITVDNGAGLSYLYSNGNLSQIQRKAGGATTLSYLFTYDDFGNTTGIQVGNKTLASYTYGPNNGMLLSQSFGNGAGVSYTYDILGRAKTTTYTGGRVLTYIYTGDGQLYSVHDSATGYTYIYTYDTLGRLSASRVEDSAGNVLMRTRLEYNSGSQITKQVWKIGNTTYQETYTYNTGDASLKSYQNALGQTVSLSYDSLRRLSAVTAGNVYTQTYTYRDIGTNKTTPQIAKLAYSGFTGAPSYGYTYDALGNIAAYTQGGKTYTYTYDGLNQLTRAVEKDANGNTTKTWSYTYDLGGNILTANDGTSSHTYTYGDAQWADLLTAFDGHAITYDASGNPLTYYNGQSYAFTWSEGRRLATATVNGSTISYAYDMDGLRVSKTVGGVKHTYTYASGKLLRETYGSNTLDFFYDQNGRPYALKYNGATYYYITNLQGDVLYLLDSAKNVAASYTYDPYGKPLTATGAMAATNPLRYRGYYYDTETSLYYLQSRYYDPTTCRFINADALASTGQGILGHNMFAYCRNNPACRKDISGATDAEIMDDDPDILDEDKVCAGGRGSAPGPGTSGTSGGAGPGMSGGAGGMGKYPSSSGSHSHGSSSNGSSNHSVCFVAGTAVLTATGNENIEQIKVGDMVWAWDEETGDVALKEVVETYINETDELAHIFVNGEEIVCTPSHPFYSPVKGWTDAVHLRAGDILVLVNGEYVVVEKVQHEILESPVTVYNFQVEDYHTYYVSDVGVLAHNKCSGSYEINFESGKNYVGKGSESRMNVSAKAHSEAYNDPVVSKYWNPAPDARTAFVDEYFKMMVRGVNNPNTYNLIWSPGRKIYMRIWE